jgi:transposase
MRFYNGAHQHWCGIDLHAKTMYLCLVDRDGQMLAHRKLPSRRDAFLEVIEPYRHELYMKAIRGGKAKNDRIDALKIATLLRGGMLPQAYAYPAGMRATRDLLRRRLHLVRKRGQLLAHIQMTSHQYNLPPLGKRIAYPSNREGVADHFKDRVVKKSIAVDLALLERYDSLLTDLELYLVRQAKQHDANAFHRLRTIPRVGKVLALTILYEIHDVKRFDRVQEFASYARLLKCAKKSAGKKLGTSGPRWATCIRSGRSPKPPSSSCATAPRARSSSPGSRSVTERARRSRSSRTNSAARPRS